MKGLRMKHLIAAIALVALNLPGGALAQSTDHAAHHPADAKAAATLAEGEVRKVDKDAKKITIKHGPIPNLDMPAMSMVFQVKDPALLDQVKAGDKIRFAAEKAGSTYTVTRIESVK
jgi:Cu(I)/Ag(I) efflux system protein CusF